MKKNNAPIVAFIGSYAEADSSGLYVCEYNPESGSLKLRDQKSELKNPAFLAVNPENEMVYAISEHTTENGEKYGAAACFQFNSESLTLKHVNTTKTIDSPTCHITLDASKQVCMVASYHGGMVGLTAVLEDGQLGPTLDVHQHSGSSLLPVQSQARAHSVFMDPTNQYALACDLGLDKIIVYKLDLEEKKLHHHGETQVAAGSGPRHFVFHPSLPYGYVINELNATITAFHFENTTGKLEEIETVSTLPEDYSGKNACADIHISPDGRFLYGSNRGHDSIVVFAIDQHSGKLQHVQHQSTLGGHPRNFALSPDGRFLLAANRDSDNIVSFIRDEASGVLRPAGETISLSKPVCIQFLSLS